jgi:dihydrofolate synthase/folylpolyglutamate synthase
MRARAAREWIAGLEILGMRFGLERMNALLQALGHPERTAPALHIVGTNGKSSTARLAAAALASQGRRVGTYLSPHVTDWTERFQIAGRAMTEAEFAAAVSAVRDAGERLDLPAGDAVTQFEALTAAAFWGFREAGLDALVVEAGLGGRYDATNVLQPGAAVALTNIALEHTELLGDTEEAIAAEKLAVAPEGSDRLVVGPLTPRAEAAVEAECARRGLRPLRYGAGLSARESGGGVEVVTPHAAYRALPLALHGAFQRDNLAVALAGAEMLLGGALERAPLAEAIGAVRVPGRLELIPGAPAVILDGAHNPAGMEALARSLPGVIDGRRPSVAVVSVLGDKDAAAMVAALAPVVDLVIATRSSHARAVDAAALAALARAAGAQARAVDDPSQALAAARDRTGSEGVVVVAGSLYLLADLRPRIVEGVANPPATLARAPGGIAPTEAN